MSETMLANYICSNFYLWILHFYSKW